MELDGLIILYIYITLPRELPLLQRGISTLPLQQGKEYIDGTAMGMELGIRDVLDERCLESIRFTISLQGLNQTLCNNSFFQFPLSSVSSVTYNSPYAHQKTKQSLEIRKSLVQGYPSNPPSHINPPARQQRKAQFKSQNPMAGYLL